MGRPHPDTPTLEVHDILKDLRIRLIDEEVLEFKRGLAMDDLLNVAKELADILVVVYGTADDFGIPMDAVFDEVMRSNMSKLIDPQVRADGKILKGEHYVEADIAGVLDAG